MEQSAASGRGLAWLAPGTGPTPLPAWIALGFLVLGFLGSIGWRPDPEPVRPFDFEAHQRLPGPAPPRPQPLASDPDEPRPRAPIRVATDTLRKWSSYDGDADRQVYVLGKVRLTISQANPDEVFHERSGLRVVVQAPGMKNRTLSWPDNGRTVMFGVGRLDRGRPGPQILLLRWTLGAHCCYVATLLTPDDDHWRVEDLDEWDDSNLWPTTFNPGEWPKDRDGDGTPEFLVPDERFRYVFEAYVASITPPRLLQVHNGQMIDVSDRRAFRPIFQAVLPRLKEDCGGEGGNGYCAAYVAAASRVGQRRQAWAWMLHRRGSRIGWSQDDCITLIADKARCPGIVSSDKDSFPLALEAFLEQAGFPS